MHALITLGIAFSLLVTYLETTVQPETPLAKQFQTATVIRAAKPAKPDSPLSPPASIDTRQVAEQIKSIKPLNLSLPTLKTVYKLKNFKSNYLTLDLLKKSSKPEIIYNAELVYDAEKGEDITGGKINITIPFG